MASASLGLAAANSPLADSLGAFPTIKPIEVDQQSFGAPLPEHEVPCQRDRPAKMVEAAIACRLALHPAGAVAAERLVSGEGNHRVAVARLEACRESHGILDGKGCALGEIRQHGMSGIADERHAPVRPAAQRFEPEQ